MDELKFANRLKSLPVLMSTCIWFSQNYERLKASNVLIRQTCELAETTVQASVHAVADPLTLRFKTQLDVLDCLACTQLDRLEHAFPLINKDMNTIVTESKSMILGSNLVAHKFLDRIEKSLVESKQRQTPSSNTTKKQQQEMKHLNKSIEASASTGDDQQQLVVATANSYPSLRVRSRLLAILLYQVARARVEEQVRVGYAIVKHSCPCVEAMSRRADEWRHAAVYTLHDRFSFTKDKLDLYKEYLDVLMRQFMVQDGRSLEHVHSLEERTKIIIRRNIGNLLIIIQLVSTNASKLSSYVLDNAVVALSKKTLCHISQLFSKPNNEKLTQELISKLISVQSSALQWMVPNFDAFGVLDELDDEISSSSTPISSNYTERPSSESIRRQLAILADEIDQTPIVRRFNARDSTTLSSSNFSSSNIS